MSAPAVQALGWALIHFLWQGALVALLLEVALRAMRERSSRARYAVRCAALCALGALPLATWGWLAARGGAVELAELGPALAPSEGELTAEQLERWRAALLAAEEALARGRPLAWLVVLWAVGASLCTARTLADYLRVRRLQASGAGAALPPIWQVRFDALARRMGVRAVARIVDSAALAAPAVIGWLRPVVLIPARALSGLSGAELELVLAHELAHVARADYLVNLLQSALEALLFYHPAVWWVSHGIRAEREFCCDDAALALTKDGALYARALTTLESWRVEPALGLSTLGGPLMVRIQRLIGIRPAARPLRGPLAAFGALLALGSVTAMAHEPAEGGDADELAELRARIEEMQSRLDELRASLAEATGEAPEVGDASDGHEIELPDGKRLRVLSPGEDRVVIVIGGDGERRVELGEKVRGRLGKLHEHLEEHLGKLHEDGEGEAHVEIEIQTDDGERRVFKKVLPLGEHAFELWHGDGEDDVDGDGHGRRAWRFGPFEHEFRFEGAPHWKWDLEDEDGGVKVLKLEGLLEAHGEHLDQLKSLGVDLDDLKKLHLLLQDEDGDEPRILRLEGKELKQKVEERAEKANQQVQELQEKAEELLQRAARAEAGEVI